MQVADRREIVVAHWRWIESARFARRDGRTDLGAKCLKVAAECRLLLTYMGR